MYIIKNTKPIHITYVSGCIHALTSARNFLYCEFKIYKLLMFIPFVKAALNDTRRLFFITRVWVKGIKLLFLIKTSDIVWAKSS